MALTPEEVAERRFSIGGSDAGHIVSGDWLPLWEIKTGRREPDDLTWVLPVQIGTVTEDLNMAFFEHATGHQVFGRNEIYVHPDYDYIRCRLDGLTLIGQKPAIIECKHVNAFSKVEEVERRYYPQVAHSMMVTGATVGYLSVILGTQKHEILEIRRDAAYISKLLSLEQEFWNCVVSDTCPGQVEPVMAPERPAEYRTEDFSTKNEWCSLAVDWLETLSHAKRNDKAAKALRALVEPDVGEASGAGIVIKRSKDGRSLYIKEIAR